MTTNRPSTEASRKRKGRDYKKEVTQQGNATKGGKKKKLKERARMNAFPKKRGKEAGHKGNKLVYQDPVENSKGQPPRKKRKKA